MSLRTATLRMPQRTNYSTVSRQKYKTGSGIKTETRSFSVREILAGTIVLFLVILSIWTSFSIKELDNEVKILEKEASRLETIHAKLYQQEQNMLEKSRLESLGKKLGLHAPTKDQLIILRDS